MDMDDSIIMNNNNGLTLKQQQIQDRLPWVEKYRPKSLNDLISHEDIISTINKLIEKNSLPHLLFFGPPGTGKTSTIQAIARKLYGDNYSRMVLELNASDDRGIDVVREQIKSFASSMFIFNSNQFKLVILDEADSMTNAAQTALRRVIEKYTKTTRFCMICNYVGRLIPALQSRCTRFRFGRLPKKAAIQRITEIVQHEKILISNDAINSVELLSEGDMRKSLNLLQSVSMSTEKDVEIDKDSIYRCAGLPTPSDSASILNWLLNQDYDIAHKNISKLKREKGLSLVDMLKDLHTLLHKGALDEIPTLKVIKEMAEIEYNLSFGASEKIQLGYLIGVFQLARE